MIELLEWSVVYGKVTAVFLAGLSFVGGLVWGRRILARIAARRHWLQHPEWCHLLRRHRPSTVVIPQHEGQLVCLQGRLAGRPLSDASSTLARGAFAALTVVPGKHGRTTRPKTYRASHLELVTSNGRVRLVGPAQVLRGTWVSSWSLRSTDLVGALPAAQHLFPELRDSGQVHRVDALLLGDQAVVCGRLRRLQDNNPSDDQPAWELTGQANGAGPGGSSPLMIVSRTSPRLIPHTPLRSPKALAVVWAVFGLSLAGLSWHLMSWKQEGAPISLGLVLTLLATIPLLGVGRRLASFSFGVSTAVAVTLLLLFLSLFPVLGSGQSVGWQAVPEILDLNSPLRLLGLLRFSSAAEELIEAGKIDAAERAARESQSPFALRLVARSWVQRGQFLKASRLLALATDLDLAPGSPATLRIHLLAGNLDQAQAEATRLPPGASPHPCLESVLRYLADSSSASPAAPLVLSTEERNDPACSLVAAALTPAGTSSVWLDRNEPSTQTGLDLPFWLLAFRARFAAGCTDSPAGPLEAGGCRWTAYDLAQRVGDVELVGPEAALLPAQPLVVSPLQGLAQDLLKQLSADEEPPLELRLLRARLAEMTTALALITDAPRAAFQWARQALDDWTVLEQEGLSGLRTVEQSRCKASPSHKSGCLPSTGRERALSFLFQLALQQNQRDQARHWLLQLPPGTALYDFLALRLDLAAPEVTLSPQRSDQFLAMLTGPLNGPNELQAERRALRAALGGNPRPLVHLLQPPPTAPPVPLERQRLREALLVTLAPRLSGPDKELHQLLSVRRGWPSAEDSFEQTLPWLTQELLLARWLRWPSRARDLEAALLHSRQALLRPQTSAALALLLPL